MNNDGSRADDFFQAAKIKYLALLKQAETEAINIQTPVSGIYALYFVLEEVEQIIPLYIGQSKNIKNRFISHKSALNKLFKKTPAEFTEHINSGKQDGNHLYTKMVLFMKSKDLNVKDLKLKVLVTNLDQTYFRLQKEQELINYYQVETFGFNQLEFIQLANRFSNMKTLTYNLNSVNKMWNCGITYLNQFNVDLMKYGFFQFNLESFVNWSYLQIARVENVEMAQELAYPAKVINPTIYLEFKNKFDQLINRLQISAKLETN